MGKIFARSIPENQYSIVRDTERNLIVYSGTYEECCQEAEIFNGLYQSTAYKAERFKSL